MPSDWEENDDEYNAEDVDTTYEYSTATSDAAPEPEEDVDMRAETHKRQGASLDNFERPRVRRRIASSLQGEAPRTVDDVDARPAILGANTNPIREPVDNFVVTDFWGGQTNGRAVPPAQTAVDSAAAVGGAGVVPSLSNILCWQRRDRA